MDTRCLGIPAGGMSDVNAIANLLFHARISATSNNPSAWELSPTYPQLGDCDGEGALNYRASLEDESRTVVCKLRDRKVIPKDGQYWLNTGVEGEHGATESRARGAVFKAIHFVMLPKASNPEVRTIARTRSESNMHREEEIS